jgi:lipopolysaccharide transport system permease protein
MQNDAAASSGIALALGDISDGIRASRIWGMLGWQEIRQRYRRSILGPFWLTISTAAMVLAMGPLYGKLLNQPLSGYFAYLAISLIAWLFLSSIVNESCSVFISAESFIKQIKLPLSIYALRCVWRNLIVFGHNLVVAIVVVLVYPPETLRFLPLFFVGVVIIALNGFWLGLALGLLCARFRDIPPIVASLTQILFFLTPVMWRPEMLGPARLAADLNPFFHFIEIVRAPLLGTAPGFASWIWVIAITVLGFGGMLVLFSRYRARIAYWL